MKYSVPQVPTYEEFFGLVDNEISDEEWDSDEDDEKKKQLIVLLLSILEEFYLDVQYYSAYDILKEEFEDKINDLNSKLKDSLLYLLLHYITDIQTEYDVKYNIPPTIVSSDVEIETVVDSGVDRITETLYSDLKDKATFYQTLAFTTGVFSLHSNFRRAIKNLTNVALWDTHYIEKSIERDYMSFVYGQEALARWRVTGINTCAWCYEMEAMGEMPLSWFPVDHVNGRCWLEIVNPDEYSEEYKEIQGWD